MRRFRGIVQNNIEPQDKEVLWLYKGVLYYFENEWQPLQGIEKDDPIPSMNAYVIGEVLFIK